MQLYIQIDPTAGLEKGGNMRNLIIGVAIGIAALFFLIIISVMSFRSGIEATAMDCLVSGQFIFSDHVFVCFEKTQKPTSMKLKS